MISTIVKHEIDHVVNLSLFKHKGDVFAVAKETGISIEYVRKLFFKLKKRRERDVSYWIASNIMHTMFEGYQQRTTYIQKYLNILEGNEGIPLSVCCKASVTKETFNHKEIYCCDKCELPCEVKVTPTNDTYKLFFELMSQLREEDKTLVEFADELGFTNKETPPTIKQNILVMDNSAVHIDPIIAKELDDLSPIQREKTRKRLESLIINSGKQETNNVQ